MEERWDLGVDELMRIAAASIRGKDHLKSGLPCQDFSIATTSSDGKWSILVVADGAGSAKHSAYGAEYSVNAYAHLLDKIASELARRPPGSWLTDEVIRETLAIRDHYRGKVGEGEIGQYASTIVGALVGASGGFVVHIGDGAAIACVTSNGRSTVEVISRPENGEYANETYFITSNDWLKRLRVTPISDVDWIVLGTDGGTAFTLLDEKTVKLSFIEPFVSRLASIRVDDLEQEVKGIISDEKADKLTGDDKSLAIAWKREHSPLESTVTKPNPTRAPPAEQSPASASQPETTAKVSAQSAELFYSDDYDESKGATQSWLKIFIALLVLALVLIVSLIVYSRYSSIMHVNGDMPSERRQVPKVLPAPSSTANPPQSPTPDPPKESAEAVPGEGVTMDVKPRDKR